MEKYTSFEGQVGMSITLSEGELLFRQCFDSVSLRKCHPHRRRKLVATFSRPEFLWYCVLTSGSADK